MPDGVVPPGLESLGPPFPALKRWAKLGGPSGAGLLRLQKKRTEKIASPCLSWQLRSDN